MILRLLVALSVLLMPFAHTYAGCQVYRPVYAPYVEKVVEVKKVVAVEYLAVPVVVPAYAVGYLPPPPPAAPLTTPCDEKVKALDEKIKALESKLSTPPMAPVTALPKSIIAGRCASCHDVAVTAAKGGGLPLVDRGVVLKLSHEVVGRVLKEVSRGKMPKGSKLTDEEFNEFLQELINLQK